MIGTREWALSLERLLLLTLSQSSSVASSDIGFMKKHQSGFS